MKVYGIPYHNDTEMYWLCLRSQRAVLWGQGPSSPLCVPSASSVPLSGLAPGGAQLLVELGLEGGRGGMGRGSNSVQVLRSPDSMCFSLKEAFQQPACQEKQQAGRGSRARRKATSLAALLRPKEKSGNRNHHVVADSALR